MPDKHQSKRAPAHTGHDVVDEAAPLKKPKLKKDANVDEVCWSDPNFEFPKVCAMTGHTTSANNQAIVRMPLYQIRTN